MAIKKPVKKEVLQRDNYSCRKCGCRDDLTLHHVLPQRLNGSDEKYSLVSLCRRCHNDWHDLESDLGIEYNAKLTWDVFFLWLKNKKIRVKLPV